ncbi:ribosome biogenesis GTPase [Herbinix hemicellulosilytica]|uniref:Small ribosomal subunit biogenesis GTPase RsgA n=1 Tax=Herbinix hemicellulosilytica TaxID=1564487 RepID=A0A0H5SWF2_HERHM|nr:ribosome small subunit-dependent GTPase A [Herbinix hemicellulosilytica]RBP56782.1 ribosome biogenesis GTPase [Herbinix hemicellulosilytica]CRZ34658.1 putative ribosome biogenesis GTPase RsgA [Herbinix hemicellulosilytica]
MKGKIIKGIAGFYYVHVPQEDKIYECKAKGVFRNQNIKPLVGDNVEIDTDDQPEGSGVITDILPRKNEIKRPAVANVDQALVMFAAAQPDPNLNLLDRFLIMMKRQNIDAIVCFNKKDIASQDEIRLLMDTYRISGYKVIGISVLMQDGSTEICDLLKGKTTVLAGPSGVGKSSLINLIKPDAKIKTGEVSEKIKRGRHTTRHSELICIDKDTYIMDTPGFSSLYIDEIDKDELKDYFIEFKEYEDMCRFIGCMHLNEPGCAVKEALNEGKISSIRYENYKDLYEELSEIKRY